MSAVLSQQSSAQTDVAARLAFQKQLQAVTNKIHATNNIDEIMLEVSADVCALFNADRLTIYSMGEDKQSIVSKVKTGLNSFKDLKERVRRGALWLDVRYPSEYQYDKLPGAINVPLAEVRNMFAVLDRSKDYIAYCQSGRRSAAAAFLFAQRGFKVWLLEGGLKAVEKPEIR